MIKQRIATLFRLLGAILFCFILYCLAAIFMQAVLWYSFYFFSSLLLVSSIMFWRSRVRILSLETKTLVIPITSSDLVVTVKQTRSLANVEVMLKLDEQELKLLPKRRGKKVSYYLDPALHLRRGYYPTGIMSLTVSDWLGFFRQTQVVILAEPVLVLPQGAEQEAQRLQKQLSQHLKTTALGNENSFNLKNIREYHQGDNFHQIDWKLTARQDQLVVKEYELEQASQLTYVFINGQSANFELLLSLFYSYLFKLNLTDIKSAFLMQKGEIVNVTEQGVAELVEAPLTEELFFELFGSTYFGKDLVLFINETPSWLIGTLNKLGERSQLTLVSLDQRQRVRVETLADFSVREGRT